MAVWFVTGASRGFGRAIIEAAYAAGHSVVAAVRDTGSFDASGFDPARMMVVGIDVTDEDQVHHSVDEASASFGRIDVLVNNAGHGLLGPIEETSDAEVREVYGVNVFGLLNVTRAVLPVMRAQGSGRIINIGSMGGFASFAATGIYASTKFAVEGITESLNGDLANSGITATVIEPGQFRTDFMDPSSMRFTAAERIPAYDQTVTGLIETFRNSGNHTQAGDPRKAAEIVVQVASADPPPVRVPLGKDAVQRVEKKLAQVAAELALWRTIGESTDFD